MRRIDDVLVDLIRDDIGIIFYGQRRDLRQLLQRKDLAAGVGRITDQNCFGTLAQLVLQNIRIKVEVRWCQRDKDRLTADEQNLRAVVFKIRRKQDHTVAGIGDRKERVDHCLRRTDGNDHLGFCIRGNAHEMLALFRQRTAEIRCAHRDRILMRSRMADLCQTVGQCLGRIKIRKALRQIDRAAVQRNARHAPDDGIGKLLRRSVQFLHNYSSILRPGASKVRRCPAISNTLPLLIGKVKKRCRKKQALLSATGCAWNRSQKSARHRRCRPPPLPAPAHRADFWKYIPSAPVRRFSGSH